MTGFAITYENRPPPVESKKSRCGRWASLRATSHGSGQGINSSTSGRMPTTYEPRTEKAGFAQPLSPFAARRACDSLLLLAGFRFLDQRFDSVVHVLAADVLVADHAFAVEDVN